MTHPRFYTAAVTTYSVRKGRHETHPTITAGEARACLATAETRPPDAPWKCNPILTRAQAIAILRRALPPDDSALIHPLLATNALRLALDVKRIPKPSPTSEAT